MSEPELEGPPEPTWVKVWLVKPLGQKTSWLVVSKLDELSSMLGEDADIGHEYCLRRERMREYDLLNTGEFDGW